ncbi:MAG TPA: nuclear transport factor 2 family protein [Mucilaginibacter sp.]|jgi:uncharacterized protein (TIGR02246 family)|nr:nuclear transport factor 2 family protein [Mucilaginibacter sp.]
METQNNEQQIKALVDNWAKAVRAKDITGILADHSADILLFDVPEPFQSKGIDAYRISWEDVFFPWYGDDGNFEVNDLQVTAGTDAAFCTGIISCSGTTDGEKVSLKVRLTIGLVKTGGRWIVKHEHHSEVSK